MAKDYNGQPRSEDGRFTYGKQTKKRGSRSKGRHVGGSSNRTRLANVNTLPPIHRKTPKGRPGRRTT